MEHNKILDPVGSSFFENRIGKERWLSTKEAADYLGISPNALRIWVCRGRIRAFKLGSRLKFRVRDLDYFLQPKGGNYDYSKNGKKLYEVIVRKRDSLRREHYRSRKSITSQREADEIEFQLKLELHKLVTGQVLKQNAIILAVVGSSSEIPTN